MHYAPRGAKGNGFVFASKDGKPHACCAAHNGTPHELAVDADACLFAWAMGHVEEFEAPPSAGLSACQLYPCPRQTTKGMRNVLCPHGKYLCDVHRRKEIFLGFIQIASGTYEVAEG